MVGKSLGGGGGGELEQFNAFFRSFLTDVSKVLQQGETCISTCSLSYCDVKYRIGKVKKIDFDKIIKSKEFSQGKKRKKG